MKNQIITAKKSIFVAIVLMNLFIILTTVSSAAGGVIVVSAESADGKPLSELEAGDVVNVTVVLPEISNTNKLQFDLDFNESVLEYNEDSDASAVLSLLTIGKTEMVGENTVRLVSAGLSSVSFEEGTVALSASFTVKQGNSGGEKDAFSLCGLKCSDSTVSVESSPLKITIVVEEPIIPDVTTVADTTSAPDVTTETDTTSDPEVTIGQETGSVTEAETSESVDTGIVDDTTAKDVSKETESITITTDGSTIDTSDKSDAFTSDVKITENTEKNEDDTNNQMSSTVIWVAAVLVIACVASVIIAFVCSKRVSLPK